MSLIISSVLSGSGTWTLITSNGGIASATFKVNGGILATGNENVNCNGAAYIEEYCEISAARMVSGQAEASATASGSGSGIGQHAVKWLPVGVPPETRYGAPPGFSFKESTAQSVQVEHWGTGGYCTGVGGPIVGGTTATATGDAGIITASTSPVYGDTVSGGSATVTATASLHSTVDTSATPGVLAEVSGNAKSLSVNKGYSKFGIAKHGACRTFDLSCA